MSPTPPSTVTRPAGSVPEHAIAFGSEGSAAVPVDGAHPLPVATAIMPSGIAPLTGSLAASGTAGPFTPILGRPIALTLTGSWSGTAQLLRSVDGGATMLPLTAGGAAWASFSGNCNEAVAEESEAGASYYLQATIASGTLAYRIAQ